MHVYWKEEEKITPRAQRGDDDDEIASERKKVGGREERGEVGSGGGGRISDRDEFVSFHAGKPALLAPPPSPPTPMIYWATMW